MPWWDKHCGAIYAGIGLLTCLVFMKSVVTFHPGARGFYAPDYLGVACLALLVGLLWPMAWVLTGLAYVAYLLS